MLHLQLLGELQVSRDGSAVPLPASKKSRALIAYLAATGRPHSRERLCELLWEGPDDPRAQLRWSLSKLRPVVGASLSGSRDRVELRRENIALDILELCSPANATTEALERCSSLFRGEFLEGLDLPSCFRYQQWCAGERERLRKLHISVLAELTRRYGATEAGLKHARRRVIVDPFDEEAHASLIHLLGSLGESQDALRQYEESRGMFERELGRHPGPEIENARRAIGRAVRPSSTASVGVEPESPFVGRSAELHQIRSTTSPVLILGEPGIGKSRLLEEVRPALYGRAFASEMVRPYGIWIDAMGDLEAMTDRDHLFESVAKRVSGVVAFDDIQWIDEASAALLHYVARKSNACMVLAARVGEIEDNPHVMRLLADLGPVEIRLAPLSHDETRDLVGDDHIAQMSGGNPLYALELARSGSASGVLSSLIASRLGRLDGAARELVAWAAAVGRRFDAEAVGRASGMPAGDMLAALEKLERAAIIRESTERNYDFTHDLIRDAAYNMVSAPRRALLHRHIARALQESHDPGGTLAGEVLHHASLAGDHDLAAAAAVTSGRRCLRMFAYSEAMTVARRGLQIAEFVGAGRRLEIEMQLLEIIVMARLPIRDRIDYAGRIAATTEEARKTGLHAVASLGAHLLACLHEETNNYGGAADATIRSAEIGRSADPATAAFSMANSARCLLFLQRDIARAETLVAQANAIGIPNRELDLATGYLHAHHGRTAEAVKHLEQAFETAAIAQDHWREWIALYRLATMSLEEEDATRALAYCARLRPVAAKMSGGSEEVRTTAVEILARFAAGEAVDVDGALAQLRAADSKSDLAWALTFLAMATRDRTRARRYATEAVETAESVGRQSEAVIARCILGLPAKSSRDITARAKRFLKERRHARSRARAVV